MRRWRTSISRSSCRRNAVEYGVGRSGRWPRGAASRSRPGPGTAAALAAVGIADVRIPRTTFDSEGLLGAADLAARARQARRDLPRRRRTRPAGRNAARARRARRLRRVLSPRRRPRRRRRPERGMARRPHRCAHLDQSSEGLDNLWALLDAADARAVARRRPSYRIRASPNTRARSGSRASSKPSRRDAGLIAGLLEWFDGRSMTEVPACPTDIIVTAPLPPFLYDPLKADYHCHDYCQAGDKPALLAAAGCRDPRPGAGRRHGDADDAARRAAEARDHFGVRRGLRRRARRLLPQARHQGDEHAGRADRRRRRRRGGADHDDRPRLRARSIASCMRANGKSGSPELTTKLRGRDGRHPGPRTHRQGDRANASPRWA